MKRKNKSQAQSEAKRKWDAQKEASKNWPPFPLKSDYAYDGSKYIELILEAFHAMNWLCNAGLEYQDKYKEYKLELWSSKLYTEQYNDAIELATDIYSTWTDFGIKLQQIPIAVNTNRLNFKDFHRLRQWFLTTYRLVQAYINTYERKSSGDKVETLKQPLGIGGQDKPQDIITSRVVIKEYELSKSTLFRAIKDGRLKDFRDKKKPKNSIIEVSRSEVEKHFAKR